MGARLVTGEFCFSPDSSIVIEIWRFRLRVTLLQYGTTKIKHKVKKIKK